MDPVLYLRVLSVKELFLSKEFLVFGWDVVLIHLIFINSIPIVHCKIDKPKLCGKESICHILLISGSAVRNTGRVVYSSQG